ncbi:Uncharacterized protein DBV15_11182 [Temnothorax longispinosus]|uniref:Uncharacterized protein n=1 Tax=Temnothorax longispinosus TaxID=300112 RepID=A0A4S2KFX7_9HYME|nr:Uncharacterized protein DBV15_11182 [Temnothorax longispinosus]
MPKARNNAATLLKVILARYYRRTNKNTRRREAFSSDERKQTEQDSANGSSAGRLGFVLQRAVKLSHGSRRPSGQLFKRDAEIRDRNAAKGGNGVVNGEIVDKTRSLLTGTESKAEERERRRGQREKR